MLRRATNPFHRPPKPAPARPLSLTDDQLRQVMIAAGPLPPEKRVLMLERVAARLDLHGPAFGDADFDQAITSAMVGLIHDHEPA